jgi:hypothetical protein
LMNRLAIDAAEATGARLLNRLAMNGAGEIPTGIPQIWHARWGPSTMQTASSKVVRSKRASSMPR